MSESEKDNAFRGFGIAAQHLNIEQHRSEIDEEMLAIEQMRFAMEKQEFEREEVHYVLQLFTSEEPLRSARILRGLPVELAFHYILLWLVMNNELWQRERITNFSKLEPFEQLQAVNCYLDEGDYIACIVDLEKKSLQR